MKQLEPSIEFFRLSLFKKVKYGKLNMGKYFVLLLFNIVHSKKGIQEIKYMKSKRIPCRSRCERSH